MFEVKTAPEWEEAQGEQPAELFFLAPDYVRRASGVALLTPEVAESCVRCAGADCRVGLPARASLVFLLASVSLAGGGLGGDVRVAGGLGVDGGGGGAVLDRGAVGGGAANGGRASKACDPG